MKRIEKLMFLVNNYSNFHRHDQVLTSLYSGFLKHISEMNILISQSVQRLSGLIYLHNSYHEG